MMGVCVVNIHLLRMNFVFILLVLDNWGSFTNLHKNKRIIACETMDVIP